MRYSKFLPSAAALQAYIREFIILESELHFDSRTIPDTALVMTFRYKGKVWKLDGEKQEALPATGISGLRKTVRLFQYERQTANLLVVFKEGGINAFTRVPVHELFELNISSDNLFLSSELEELLEQLAEAVTDKERIRQAESFLLGRLNLRNKPDPMISQALAFINQHSGIVRIKNLAASLYVSQDAFEKKFRSTVGATPKQYASIIRMKDLIKKYPSYASLTDAAYEAGYFDQSHFIKDFRLFTGRAPKDFFSNFQYW
ncbi:MAG TPA: helix-turn-helix transcriptional regulator [Puia sp.]|nr:helix-turn-helix transcriptional regulator [Puia sp.]